MQVTWPSKIVIEGRDFDFWSHRDEWWTLDGMPAMHPGVPRHVELRMDNVFSYEILMRDDAAVPVKWRITVEPVMEDADA